VHSKPEWVQAGWAVTVLALGILVYMLDRPSASVYFVPDTWIFSAATPSLFGTLGSYLPTFTHVFAFILLTAAVLRTPLRSPFAICAIWFSIEALFEVAQMDAIADVIDSIVPLWFEDWPLLDNVAGYFVAGRFDPLDIASLALGAAAAYAAIQYSIRKKDTK